MQMKDDQPLVSTEAELKKWREAEREWVRAARKALDGDEHDLREMVGGRGWADTPAPVVELIVAERDRLATKVAEFQRLFRNRPLAHDTAFYSPPGFAIPRAGPVQPGWQLKCTPGCCACRLKKLLED